MIEDKELTRKVALWKSQYGSFMVLEMVGTDPDKCVLDGWVRVTEWMDVTFRPLGADAIIGGQLKALAKIRAKTVDEFKSKLDHIDGQMANLRALTDGTGKP